MEAYTGFAYVYDTFMDNIPYEEWAEYVAGLLGELSVETGSSITELGCGTGKFTMQMAQRGYAMTGIDCSEDMLAVAMDRKLRHQDEDTTFLQMDMREFSLYENADAMISVCDSMNYLIEDGDMEKTFRCIGEHLRDGGVFIFDMKTEYFYREVLGENTFAENREECSFIWDNYFYDEEKINEYILTIFNREENGLYRKYEETHYQRAYKVGDILTKAEKAGLEKVAVYDAFTHDAPKWDSERIYVIVRKNSK